MFNKTVDSILSSLTKNIKALETLADAKRTQAAGDLVVAASLTDRAGIAHKEVARAVAVADKIRALIA